MDVGYHHASFRPGDGSDRGPTAALLDHARWLEREGFDWLTLMDHLWQLPGVGRRDEPFLDCYTALPAVAQATDRMELSALVTCPHYRNPGYLARALATLDRLSGGRAVLSIGAGWYEAEYEALGIEYPDPSTRNRQMRETVELCRAAWTEDSPVDYEGEHYALDGLYLEPKPVRNPIPVLVGGGGEQLTLRATAEYADRWNVITDDPDEWAHKLAVLREHCADLGRDYDAITKVLGTRMVLREDEARAHEAYEELVGRTERDPEPRAERGGVGTPADAAALLEAFAGSDLDTFLLLVPSNDRRTRELFVDEVLPGVD